MSSEDEDFITMPFLFCHTCGKSDGIYCEELSRRINIKRILYHLRRDCIDKADRFEYCNCEGQDHKIFLDEVMEMQINE